MTRVTGGARRLGELRWAVAVVLAWLAAGQGDAHAQAFLTPGGPPFGVPAAPNLLRPATAPVPTPLPNQLLRSLDPDLRRGVTVSNRPRPEYDPVGIAYGPLIIRPTLRLDTMFDDNILGSGRRRESDVIFATGAGVDARTRWSNHELRLTGGIEDRRYLEFDTENATDWRIAGSGRLDITRFQTLDARLSAARIFVPRDDAEDFGTVEPVAVDERSAALGYSVRENRLGLRLLGQAQTLRFDDSEIVSDTTGQVIPFAQNFRNRNFYLGSAGLTYEIAPLRNAVVIARANRRDYTSEPANAGRVGGPLARSSTGYEVLAGLDSDVSGIFAFRVLVGWLQQFYEDDRLPNPSAPTLDVSLSWNPTTLTSLRVGADRQVTESIRVNNSAILRTNLFATVDHELARNVLLNAGLAYRIEDYEGISRIDRTLTATLGATWLVNRNLRVGGFYTRQEADRSAGSPDYDRNIFMLRLSTAL
jgi:hypothetical protein